MASQDHALVALVKRRFTDTSSTLQGALNDLATRLNAVAEELLSNSDLDAHLGSAPGGTPDFGAMQRAIVALDEERNQVNILKILLDASRQHCARACLFVVRGETATGWAASGFTGTGTITDERVKAATIPLSADTILKAATTSGRAFIGIPDQHSQNRMLLDALGGVIPMQIASFPLVNKGRIAAVLYTDSGDAPDGLASSDAIDILTRAAAMSIELLPVRGKGQPVASAPSAPVAAPSQPVTAPSQPVARPVAGQPQPTTQPSAPRPVAAPVATPSAVAAAPAKATPDVASLPPEEQKLHEAAKRLARVLVSDIKLYNEAKVVEGRKERDMYTRLKEDIDRSRQMYGQRVNPKIAGSTDYFFEELVKTLAEGDRATFPGYPH